MDTTGPQCQACLRTPENKLPFFCCTCARNLLYEPRLKHAQILLSKEALAEEIEQATLSQNEGGNGSQKKLRNEGFPPDNIRGPGDRLVLEQTRTQITRSKTRTLTMLEESKILHGHIEQMRADVARRKEALASRSSSLKAASGLLQQEDDRSMRPLQKNIASTQGSWDRLHNRTAEARVFLCGEAAALYGLQQRKRKKGTSVRDLYLIGGVSIVDLRDLNSADPEQVTTSISRVAHLLHLTSHYLGLRLPAEISLATASQPYCLIHTPLSSYKNSITSPSSRPQMLGAHSAPRQRILSLDRPLHQLASEDPINYSLFIDAITLLAWDVAWIAKIQGLEVGAKNWEEICALGKNMWNLFAAPPRPPTLQSRSSATNLSKGPNSSPRQTPSTPVRSPGQHSGEATIILPVPGQYSHSSSHSFLPSSGSDGGAEHLRGWRFANPVRIIERIKSALLNERTGAEWEVLEKPESDEAEEEQEENSAAPGKERVVAGLTTVEEDQASEDILSEQSKPKKGWTKVRGPSIET